MDTSNIWSVYISVEVAVGSGAATATYELVWAASATYALAIYRVILQIFSCSELPEKGICVPYFFEVIL